MENTKNNITLAQSKVCAKRKEQRNIKMDLLRIFAMLFIVLLLIPNALILFALGVCVDFVYEISLGKLIGKMCVAIENGCKKLFCKQKNIKENDKEENNG